MNKKTVHIDPNGLKELNSFNKNVQADFYDLFKTLEQEGKLIYPFSKKLHKPLFEIRVNNRGQFRVLYAYQLGIIVLSAFQKKSQKTPTKEIIKALKRLKSYEK